MSLVECNSWVSKRLPARYCGGCVCSVVPGAAGEAKLLNPENVPEFFTAIGRNTGYIIHPEEVLADNFVFLLTGHEDLPNPEIVERLGNWIDTGSGVIPIS